jgi:hypothetical protein
VARALRESTTCYVEGVARSIPLPPEVLEAVRRVRRRPQDLLEVTPAELDRWAETGEFPECLTGRRPGRG